MELFIILVRESYLKICYCIVLDVIVYYFIRLIFFIFFYFLFFYIFFKYIISI